MRGALERKLRRKHGDRAVEAARTLLADVLETLGGAAQVRARRVRMRT